MMSFFDGHVHFGLALATTVLAAVAGAAAGGVLTRDIIYDYTLSVDAGSNERIELQYGIWPELSNSNFFEKVREGFIHEQANFVEANLSDMTMNVYREGVQTLSVPIKSKGRDGSWWETPSGLYRAQGKEDRHFSSFGKVYMPYSVPFQGNFFIHGWPYYPDGTPVAEGYSGGCIRLEDVYAEQVYELIEVGMPILVFEEAGEESLFSYELEAPKVQAASYLAVDIENNFVLLAGDTQGLRETRLLAKMMTAVVASEHQNIEKKITVREDMLKGVTQKRLTTHSSYSLYDLFFPLLLEDSRAAAQVLAGYFGEKRFVSLMRAKAEALGMKNTAFMQASGETRGNVTTAEDVFLFLKYLNSNRPFILAMSADKTDTRLYGKPVFKNVNPVHPFSSNKLFVGGAAASTSATTYARAADAQDTAAAVSLVFADSNTGIVGPGGDLLTILEMPFNGSSRNVAFIVLDSATPEKDTNEMVSFVKRMYR